MINSKQKKLVLTNEAIRSNFDKLRDLSNIKDKNSKTRAKIVDLSNKLFFLMGYKTCLEEILNIQQERRKEEPIINDIQKETVGIQK